MPILNYTTTVTTEKTIGEIQKRLRNFGASAVLIEFGPEGEEAAISFRYMHEGTMLTFQLPARIDSIYKILCDQCTPRYRTKEQAARVAWRIIKDWLAAQLALVEAEQADMPEVFLPYMQHDGTGQTLYKIVKDRGYHFGPLLEGPK